MAQVDIPIERSFEVDDRDAAWALLSDAPDCLSHCPKLQTLTPLGGDSWRWEFEPMGARGVSHQVRYAVTYHYDKDAGTIIWTPVEGEGNATVSGAFRLQPAGQRTRVELTIDCLLEVPVPGLLTSFIGPFARKEFEWQVDQFMKNLEAAIQKR